MTGPRIDVDLCVLYVDTLKSSSILGAFDRLAGWLAGCWLAAAAARYPLQQLQVKWACFIFFWIFGVEKQRSREAEKLGKSRSREAEKQRKQI